MSFFWDLREWFKQGSWLEPSINYKAEKERLDAQKQDEITLKQKQQLEEENPLTTRIAKWITEIPTKFWGWLFGGLWKLFEFEKIEEIEKRADDTSIAKTQKYVHDISRDYSSSIARAEVGAKVVKEKADDIYNKARKLETLQPYTAERQNLTKELNTLKWWYSNSLELYKNEINKINDLTKQRELYEKTRWPAAEYFEDPAKRNFFIANTYQKLDDATDINNRKDYESTKIAKTSIDAVVKNLQTAWEDYIKAGVIDDYEDFYTAPEIIKWLDTYSNWIKKLVMENHDKLLDENGNIDKLKLDSMMANSEEAIMLNAWLDEFLRNTRNDAKLKLYKEKVDKWWLLRW